VIEEITVIRMTDGESSEAVEEVVEEMPLALYVNGRWVQTAMISPSMIKEFVIGHLFAEKVVKACDEIESIQIEENIAKVLLKDPLGIVNLKKVVLSGCGGGSSFLDESKLPRINTEFTIDWRMASESMSRVLGSEIHRRTRGVHSVGLFNKEGEIVIADDIGRHNALDKVIGYAIGENIDFKETFVGVTGRISSDMVLKCVAVEIPIILSKGAVTSLAVEIGKITGMTIIGFVSQHGMRIYTGRIS